MDVVQAVFIHFHLAVPGDVGGVVGNQRAVGVAHDGVYLQSLGSQVAGYLCLYGHRGLGVAHHRRGDVKRVAGEMQVTVGDEKFHVAEEAAAGVPTGVERLLRVGLHGDDVLLADAQQLAHAAITAAQGVKPQHLLAEIGPCGLPLDASSKASLNENRAQYANAARAFADEEIDAFFLNGFSSIADLKCALMGLAQVSDRPVFASVALGRCDWTAQEADARPKKEQRASGDEKPEVSLPFGGGYVAVDEAIAPPLPAASRARLALEAWPEAIDAMVDLGASVVGFEAADPIADALTYATIAVERTNLPILAQLRVTNAPSGAAAKNLVPLEDIDEYTPDTMANAAIKLYGAGVQFLRATGAATPAYTGALAATVTGLDVRRL